MAVGGAEMDNARGKGSTPYTRCWREATVPASDKRCSNWHSDTVRCDTPGFVLYKGRWYCKDCLRLKKKRERE